MLVAQRIHGTALGSEDLNNYGGPRPDPVPGLVSARGNGLLRVLDAGGKVDAEPARKWAEDGPLS